MLIGELAGEAPADAGIAEVVDDGAEEIAANRHVGHTVS
jgi:hypothetical protein